MKRKNGFVLPFLLLAANTHADLPLSPAIIGVAGIHALPATITNCRT